MFDFNPSPEFWAQAKFTPPGKTKPAVFQVKFRHKTRDELDEWFKAEGSDEEKLAEVMVDWKDIPGVEYTRENLAALLNNHAGIGMTLVRLYASELTGLAGKN